MISCASVSRPSAIEFKPASSNSAHSGERLHRAVVQLVRKSPPFVLFRGEQLIRKTRPLRLAHSRVVEQLRVLVLARGEVREHGRAHDVLAIEGRSLAVSRSAPISSSCARSGITIAFSGGRAHAAARRARAGVARASNSRSASWRVRSSTSAPPTIEPIVSTSDSRKRASLVSSRSAASCRRRSRHDQERGDDSRRARR